MTKLDIKQYLKQFFLKNGVICDSFDQEKDTIARTAHAEIKRLETKLADKSGDMSILLGQLEISDQRLERRTKYKDELIEKQREIILRLTDEKGQQEKECARIDLAYCSGFSAGYNAAHEPEYPERLVNSIELRRLKALQVLKPERKLPSYKKFCADLKIEKNNG